MRKTLGIVGLSISAAVLAGCQSYDPPPFDPRALEQIQKQDAAQRPPSVMNPLPTTLPAMPEPDQAMGARPYYRPATTQPVGKVVRLTLQQIIHRTAANNLDARVAGYQASIDEARILEALAAFDPTFFASYQYQNQYPQGLQPGLDPTQVLSHQLESGFRQRLYSGAQVQVSARSTRSEFDSQPFIFNPVLEERTIYDSQISFQITQPLLRDFGTEVNRARITIARNDQKISQLAFREELERQIISVEQAYWELYLAVQNLQIQEVLLEHTDAMLDILVKRRGQDVALLQITQARGTLENRAAGLVQLRQRIRDLSDQIKRIMNDPDLPVMSAAVILPADDPVMQPVRFAIEEQIEAAFQNRLELMQQSLRIDSARTVQKAAKNNERPQLNAVGQVNFQGVSESWKESVNDIFDDEILGWALGFQFEVPIGNRQARAIYQRTMLQLQQAIDQYRLVMQDVANEVAQAHNAVTYSWEQLVARRREVFAQRDALRAIELRQETGEPLTFSFVQLKLDQQGRLAQSASDEAQALAAYNTAIARLEQAKGTLLRYNNVVMKEEKGPAFTRIAEEPKKQKRK